MALTKIQLASGSGYTNLQSAASSVIAQMGNDVSGTQYEMTVNINAPGWAIKGQIWAANHYFSTRGVTPWSGNSQVVFQDSSNPKLIYFQWLG